MIERIREWLRQRGLVGRKLYLAIGAVAALLLIVVVIPSMSGKKPQTEDAGVQSTAMERSAPRTAKEGGAIDMPSIPPELIQARAQQRLDKLDQDSAELRGRLARIEKLLEEAAETNKKTRDEIEAQKLNTEAAIRDIRDQKEAAEREGGRKPRAPMSSPLEIITVPKAKEKKPRADAERRDRSKEGLARAGEYWAPAGSMVVAKLLNGVECPPASGAPGLPILMLTRGSLMGPNSADVPLDGCMALGRCDGDLSSERVRVNVTLLSCVFPGGRTLDRAVQGYISGVDGKYGMPGKVHDKRGRKLGMAVLSGFTAGLAQALGQSEVTRVMTAEGTERTFISGSTMTFGMSQALSSALAEVTNFYRAEMQRLFPVIEVASGTEATLILEQGVDVPELGNLMSEGALDPIQ